MDLLYKALAGDFLIVFHGFPWSLLVVFRGMGRRSESWLSQDGRFAGLTIALPWFRSNPIPMLLLDGFSRKFAFNSAEREGLHQFSRNFFLWAF